MIGIATTYAPNRIMSMIRTADGNTGYTLGGSFIARAQQPDDLRKAPDVRRDARFHRGLLCMLFESELEKAA
jgi:hypothetical protein